MTASANWIWQAYNLGHYYFSKPSYAAAATACTFTVQAYAVVSGTATGKVRIQVYQDATGSTTLDCDTGTTSAAGPITLTATATAGQLGVIGGSEFSPNSHLDFRTSTVQTAGSGTISIGIISVSMDVTMDYYTHAENALVPSTSAPSAFSFSGTWKSDTGLPLQNQWVSIVYYCADVDNAGFPTYLMRVWHERTDSGGAFAASLKDRCLYATILPGYWDAGAVIENNGFGCIYNAVQHWGKCDSPVDTVITLPAIPIRRILYSPATVGGIAGAKNYSNSGSYLSGAQAAVNIVTNGLRPKIKVYGTCGSTGVYNCPNTTVQAVTPYGSETGVTDTNGVLSLSATDPNAIIGINCLSGLPTCSTLNTGSVFNYPTDGFTVSAPRSALSVYTDTNLEPYCTNEYVLKLGLACGSCNQQASSGISADIYEPNGSLSVAWTNASGALKVSTNRASLHSGTLGMQNWTSPISLETANASDVGLTYMPGGKLYLTYDLSAAKKYRTCDKFGGSSSGDWSASGTPSPAVSRHSDSSRGTDIAFRVRATGNSASGSIEFSQVPSQDPSAWSSPVTINTVGRGPYCGAEWNGQKYILLYTRDADGKIYTQVSTNGGVSWTASPGTDTTKTGQVSGLACNDAGVLCAPVWDNGTGSGSTNRVFAMRSRDGGDAWEKDASYITQIPALSTPPQIVAYGHYFIIIWVSSDQPQFVISEDGGTTWTNGPAFVSAVAPLVEHVTTITANYSATNSDHWIFVDATAGAVTVTLPAATDITHSLGIKKIDASANAVTVQRAGADLIEGSASTSLAAQWNSVLVMSDGVSIWGKF